MRYLELNSQIVNKKNGFFQLEKDKEALQVYLTEVKEKMLFFHDVNVRMKYLIENNYYEDFYKYYTEEQIVEIYTLVNAYEFRFATYMSASKFYRDYALKSDDKSQYLERYEDRVVAVALSLAQGVFDKAKVFAKAMINQNYQPATPTFLNAGRKRRGEMISCFLLEVGDSLNSITFNISTAMQLSKIGGGVALNLSKLRSRGEAIKGVENVAKGVVPVMKLLEDSFNYADQMGQRKGAGAVYLNIFHYDIEEFLDTKKINADEKSRIQTLSLGITVPDKFFELAKENADFYVFAPYTVKKAFGVDLDEIDLDKRYMELVNHKEVKKKKLNARNLLLSIAKLQFESGYPYLIYLGNANKANPLKNIAKIKMSNLCTEIFQIQQESIINNYDEEDQIGQDISCVLGSLNIVNVMENKAIEESVYAGMDAITAVSDMANVKNAPSINKANRDLHSVGLGAMNLHGYLTKNEISYESEEARDFANTFFAAMNYYSLRRSCEIAKEKKEFFQGFEKSDYSSGIYFDKYLNEDFSPNSPKVQQLFQGIYIPNKRDWDILKKDVQKYGLYHAYRLAIAPTQGISYVQNSTPSVMPVVDLIETRVYGNSTSYYPMPYLTEDTMKYYTTAYNTDMYKLIDMVATIQQHIDQGISTVLYVTNQNSTKDLIRLYLYAYKQGLKSLYYTRTKNLTIEECLACAI